MIKFRRLAKWAVDTIQRHYITWKVIRHYKNQMIKYREKKTISIALLFVLYLEATISSYTYDPITSKQLKSNQ